MLFLLGLGLHADGIDSLVDGGLWCIGVRRSWRGRGRIELVVAMLRAWEEVLVNVLLDLSPLLEKPKLE